MEWQLGPYRFCDDKHLLWRAGHSELLEPKQAEVLAYFCRHPGRLISRDEFIAEVWQGQIVTDNAINRVIARLRKSLDDPAKGSAFIITLPKKGYRFIAPVSQLTPGLTAAANEPEPPTAISPSASGFAATQPQAAASKASQQISQERFGVNWQRSSWLAVPVLLVLLLWWLLSDAPQFKQQQAAATLPASYQLSPLTRESGEEQHAALSPDGRFLLYSNGAALMLKDLHTEHLQQLNSGSGRPGNGDWSADGLQYVFFAHSPGHCVLNIIRFARQHTTLAKSEITPLATVASTQTGLSQLGQPASVHSCTAGSYGNVRFLHDGQSIVFSQKPPQSAPLSQKQSQPPASNSYQIYLKNLHSGKLQIPAQPAAVLAGNVEFDLHPTKAQLLIASPDVQQQLSYYLLDLPSNQLEHLFNKDSWLCCPVWAHSGDAIWQTAASPANRILQFGLDGTLQAHVFSASHDIRGLRRSHDGNSYLYTGWSSRREILALSLAATTTATVALADAKRLIHSSVSESLPTLSTQQQWLAFVSERSGSREVWLYRLHDGTLRKLSQFASNDWIYDLQWSPDDQQLAVLLSNQIQLLDVNSGQTQPLALPAQQIRALSWVSPHKLAFSLQQQQRWQLFHYDLNRQQLQPQPARWAYGYYAGNSEPELLIDQQLQLYRHGKQLPIVASSGQNIDASNNVSTTHAVAPAQHHPSSALPGTTDATHLYANPIDQRSRRWSFYLWQHQLYFLSPKTPQTAAQPQQVSGHTWLMQFDLTRQQARAVALLPANTSFSIGSVASGKKTAEQHSSQLFFSQDEPAQADIFQLSPQQPTLTH